MIVRMDGVVLTPLLPENLQGAVRNDLVCIHVGGGAGATLNHVDAEMSVVQSLPDLARGQTDRVHYLAVQEVHIVIGPGRRLLHRGESRDEAGEFAQSNSGDREVFYRPKGLNPIQRGRRDIALSEQVVLPPGRSREIDLRSAGGFESQRSQSGWVSGLHA